MTCNLHSYWSEGYEDGLAGLLAPRASQFSNIESWKTYMSGWNAAKCGRK